MNAYFALLRCRFASLVQYKAAVLAGIATQIFWGILKVMILTAFYASSTKSQPMTLQEAITFIWIGQMLFLLLPWNIDKDIEAQIKSGVVVYELIRPIDLYWLWFSRSLALRLFPALLRSLIICIIASLCLGMSLPISPSAAFLFFLSMCFATLLASSITTLVMISLFWTISGEGLLRLLPQVTLLLSGLVVPLPLFPEWLQPFILLQPFRAIVDIPSRIYTGLIPVSESLFWIGFQSLWLFILIIMGKWLMKKALRQFVVQGE